MTEEKNNSFENAIKRLEEIVDLLEDGSPGLEGALTLFEEGKSLITSCQEKLDQAEQKIKVLTEPERS